MLSFISSDLNQISFQIGEVRLRASMEAKQLRKNTKKAVKLVISGDRDIDTLKKDGTKQHLLYRNK